MLPFCLRVCAIIQKHGCYLQIADYDGPMKCGLPVHKGVKVSALSHQRCSRVQVVVVARLGKQTVQLSLLLLLLLLFPLLYFIFAYTTTSTQRRRLHERNGIFAR
jgi:hypothetical protein